MRRARRCGRVRGATATPPEYSHSRCARVALLRPDLALDPGVDAARELQKKHCVRVAHGIHFATRMELLGRERADRLEQRVPLSAVDHTHEPFSTSDSSSSTACHAFIVGEADLFHRLESPSLVEDRQSAQAGAAPIRRAASSSS